MATAGRRLASWVALATFAAGLLTPFSAVHVGDDPDLAYAGADVVPTHIVEQFEGILPPVGPEHCALCHWLQAMTGASPRPAVVAAVTLAPEPERLAPAQVPPERRIGTQRSSRAPPASVA